MINQKKPLIDSFLSEIQYALGAIYDNSVPKGINKDDIELNNEQAVKSICFKFLRHIARVTSSVFRGFTKIY